MSRKRKILIGVVIAIILLAIIGANTSSKPQRDIAPTTVTTVVKSPTTKLTVPKAVTSTTLAPTTLAPTLPPATSPLVTTPPATPAPAVTVTQPPAPPAPPVTTHPTGATAKCNDGTFSSSAHHQGSCSRHKGVAVFYS